MSEAGRRSRRRIKVRGGTLGWFLCWAVVFADIGTSVYYVPGILFGHYGARSAIFVSMTLVVFVFLALKYAEVAWRFPEGGGVVNVAARALHPLAGMLGGMFIIVDYYLTAAISALSGLLYLSVLVPRVGPIAWAVTIAVLVGLGVLNVMGIKESARASAAVAVVAAAGQLVVVIAVAVSLGPAGIWRSFESVGQGPPLTPLTLITGFAAAFLAFSGLETVAQLAPAMREPRRRIAFQAMGVVVLTMAVTSPLLTLWSTTLLRVGSDPNQFISLLGAHVAGSWLGAYVAMTGALLLVFASNTAIIGAYHVFIALSRMGFLPRALETRNRWRRTPHWAILLAVAVPAGVIAVAQDNVELLGDLYAFGLLGAFVLTCLSLDIVRWHDHVTWHGVRRWVVLVVGALTTVAVMVGWATNLVAKPLATGFGGGLTVLGLVIGILTYLRRRPVVFPFMIRPNVPVTPISLARRMQPAEVLAVLPHEGESLEPVVLATRKAADGRPVVFLYRGDPPDAERQEIFEVTDPYLRDKRAQAAFASANRLSRGLPDRRYVYVPGGSRRQVVADVWRTVEPRETLLAEGDEDVLPPVALDRVRRTIEDGMPVLHLVRHRPLPSGGGA